MTTSNNEVAPPMVDSALLVIRDYGARNGLSTSQLLDVFNEGCGFFFAPLGSRLFLFLRLQRLVRHKGTYPACVADVILVSG